jgi:hypothetical protein
MIAKFSWTNVISSARCDERNQHKIDKTMMGGGHTRTETRPKLKV